jgi:hypothetical protein
MKLHCACVRASARAHTHTHIHAQHADESARGEFEPLLARTLTHGSKRARARTFHARATKHISKNTRTRTAGRAGTARHTRHRCVYSHARARGVCARTHSVLDTHKQAHRLACTCALTHTHTATQPHPRARRQVRCAPPPVATVKRRAAAEKNPDIPKCAYLAYAVATPSRWPAIVRNTRVYT